MSRWTGKRATAGGQVLDGFLAAGARTVRSSAVTVPAVVPHDCSMAAQTAAAEAREKAHARVNRPSWSVTSVTEEARHIARMTRSVDASLTTRRRSWWPTRRRIGRMPGQAWGTLVHGLLEHAMRHRSGHARGSAPARHVAHRRGAAVASGDRRSARHGAGRRVRRVLGRGEGVAGVSRRGTVLRAREARWTVPPSSTA